MAGPRLPNLEKAIPSQSLPSQFPGLRRRPSHCSRSLGCLPALRRQVPFDAGWQFLLQDSSCVQPSYPRLAWTRYNSLFAHPCSSPRQGWGIRTWSLVTKGKRVRTLFRVRTLRLYSNSLDAETSVRRALPVLRTTRLAAARRQPLQPVRTSFRRIRRTFWSRSRGR
jgi:hypothetical protein